MFSNGTQFAMKSLDNCNWSLDLDITPDFKYKYCVDNHVESGDFRNIIKGDGVCKIYDAWRDEPCDKPVYSSFFKDYVYNQNKTDVWGSIIISVNHPYLKPGESIAMVGSSEKLGRWNIDYAKKLSYVDNYTWALALDHDTIKTGDQYKFIIQYCDGCTQWEEGSNRVWNFVANAQECIQLNDIRLKMEPPKARAAGVAVPVFSLRSENSVGIGDFADLEKFVLWCSKTGMKIVQILPINDTTTDHSWRDSYPYSSISIYALHPIYMSLEKMGVLLDVELAHQIADQQQRLNSLDELDYPAVEAIKQRFFRAIYDQDGHATIDSGDFKRFFDNNKHWLLPYCLYCHLRDVNNVADYNQWGYWSVYNAYKAENMIATESVERKSIMYYAFLQYHLDKQLKGVRDSALRVRVALKGDIPIGIARNSVEAWVEPHLFNLNSQAGAPPDDFAVNGQNWGFPTYNWDEMAKNGYSWWKKRFKKMEDYFDLYRIDHILGFFRIWSIPIDYVNGLSGQFSPALPMTFEQIREWGFDVKDYHTKPYLYKEIVASAMGSAFPRYKEFFNKIEGLLEFKQEYENQRNLSDLLSDQTDLRDSLLGLYNERLFFVDINDNNRFHPNIGARKSAIYNSLDNFQKSRFDELYNNYFYQRHNDFWAADALKKLPALIESTQMLCCAEDLGMIPACVPRVLEQIQVLTLEVERMPKGGSELFAKTQYYPYHCVCTTSTHDMPTIKMLWYEGLQDGRTQIYYNNILERWGEAPKELTRDICDQIVKKHLDCNAMLTILPLQDWFTLDSEMSLDYQNEQINNPENPNHHWKYRIPMTIEKLDNNIKFINTLHDVINSSCR